MKKLLLFLSVGVFLFAGSAMAIPIAPTNWDAISSGLFVLQGPITDDFTTPSATDIGDLSNWVYVDDLTLPTQYYYVHTVTPGVNNISEFNTGFGVNGFDPSYIAGYSYSEASGAVDNSMYSGTGSDLFLIDFQSDYSLDWDIQSDGTTSQWWDTNESITFFFMSDIPPGLGDYNIINAEVGTAQSYAPVPEPATMLLLGSGLLGLGVFGRKKFFKKA